MRKMIIRYCLFFGVFITLIASFFCFSAVSQSVSEYAPILYFEAEETCYPVDVDYLFDNSELGFIEFEDSNFTFYNNIHGTPTDNGVINDYISKSSLYDYKIYYRQYLEGGSTIYQYWMFYAFNKGELNSHEADWEMVQVMVPASGEISVSYSQHYGGQIATWDQVEKEGSNIKVYVARGSHANYFRSYSGKVGISSDIVGANGKILKPTQYNLEELDSQEWLDFEGLWGEINSEQDLITGSAGPFGPKYRVDMSGNNLWDGSSWANSLLKADDNLFLVEWLFYNFVTIFILSTLILLAVTLLRIYMRHKKYGLGPRILSTLYIDGINLHSIGNILCIVGVIIAIAGLFTPWYSLSGDIRSEGFDTGGMIDILSFDGIEGMRMNIPGSAGPAPMGTIGIPFALFIGIGILFMFLACVGIYQSRKLGRKYIFRGIKIFLPIVLLLIALVAMGSFISSSQSSSSEGGGDYFSEIINSISSSPFGGEKSISDSVAFSDVSKDVYMNIKWGLGLGGYLLLLSGIIILISGIIVSLKKIDFFQPKIIDKKKKEKQKQTVPMQKKDEKVEPTKIKYCEQCGHQLQENDEFCPECGKKT